MFPIQDVRNRVIAFGGRVLDDSKPKYINSPENIVYSKGRNLFGLNVARKNNPGLLDRILIVEGYMDAISLYQRGITNVVASLGTALTDSQGRLLRKNAKQVILGYDSDGPGQEAIIRGMDILKNMGVDIRVLQISGAKDPDEYVIKYGADRFKQRMDEAISVVEYKVKNLTKDINLNNTNDKILFLNQIAKILAEVDNTMEREVYVDKLSKAYDISKEAIYGEINKIIYKNNANPKIIESNTVQRTIKIKKSKIDERTTKREKTLIYLLINYPKVSYEKIKNTAKIDLIKDENNKQIISKIYERYEKELDSDNITDWFEDEDLINYLSGILIEDYEITDINKALDDIEKAYIREKIIVKRDSIIKKLENKDNFKEQERFELEKELNNVIIELAKIK